MPFALVDDTIVAIATPPGSSAAGIIRLSGPDAFSIVPELTRADDESACTPPAAWGVTFERLWLPLSAGGSLAPEIYECPCRVFWMPGPRSYTREDVAEILLPGASPLLHAAMREICRLGARVAEPGEFTLRAFLNDRIDLAQAEAVERIVNAATEADRREAISRLAGDLSARIGKWRSELLRLAATVEVALDFEEEDLGEDVLSGFEETLVRLRDGCVDLAESGGRHRPVEEGVSVVLAGLTNAGKSSLLNALTGEDRAIVSDEASTTRDHHRHRIILGDIPFILEDAPGYDPAGDGLSRLASDRGQARIAAAQVICLVLDSGEPVGPALREYIAGLPGERVVPVLNKADLSPRFSLAELDELIRVRVHEPIRVSALTGENVDALCQALRAVALGELSTQPAGQVGAREAVELTSAARHMDAALNRMRDGAGVELVAEEVRAAHEALSRGVGEGYAEDVLNSVFSHFCIGK